MVALFLASLFLHHISFPFLSLDYVRGVLQCERTDAFGGRFAVSRREEMLERIRKALGQPGQPPMSAPEAHNAPPLINPMPSIRREEIVPKFEAEWGKVGGLAHRVSSLEDLERVIG